MGFAFALDITLVFTLLLLDITLDIGLVPETMNGWNFHMLMIFLLLLLSSLPLLAN